MNSAEIFWHIFDSFREKQVEYAILHAYQRLPACIDSDIDTVIRVKRIEEAIELLHQALRGTDWRIIQYWKHEHFAADCVISNDAEFLQVDFCSHYARNGRVLLQMDALLARRRSYQGFYVPARPMEFSYILLKKLLKGQFTPESKLRLTELWEQMSPEEQAAAEAQLRRYFAPAALHRLLQQIQAGAYESLRPADLRRTLRAGSFSPGASLRYQFFDCKRKLRRVLHPTGLFVVLLGVDGAGKTTLSALFAGRYAAAFRRVRHYHSRVRVLQDLSRLGRGAATGDASQPHGQKKPAGKLLSLAKFGYYYLDYLMGNAVIALAKIKSTLVVVERYYYDYTIDKRRYNLRLSDGFLRFWGRWVKQPDVIFVLTGDAQKLYERKQEIPLREIQLQQARLEQTFAGNPRVVWLDTTQSNPEVCVDRMLQACNTVMRENCQW